jgi:type IV pilus biogenesis protein CpaD/CtpE
LIAVRGVVLITALALLLAACGSGSGSGGSRLSASAYRAEITKIRHETARAQSQVALGLQAKTLAELRQRLDAFAASTAHAGDQVAKLNPPENAEAANTQLAKGLHDTAKATHTASGAVAKLHTPREAIAFLESSHLNDKGAQEVNDAVRKLTKLGYTSGS